MKFSVITLFPQMISEVLKMGVIGQALAQEKLQVEVWTPRDWTADVHRTVDDRPFGGGDGMVLMPEPLSQCLDFVLARSSVADTELALQTRPQGESQAAEELDVLGRPRCLYMSPQGRRLDHPFVLELAKENHLLLLCGRYAGVDQRLLNHYQFEEVSMGDFVLSGGELAALTVIDSVGRQREGVLGHSASAFNDSFSQDNLLESPCFTRPRCWKNQEVPGFLLTGHHQQIEEDRWLISVLVTWLKRPDLFHQFELRQGVEKKVWRRALIKLKALSHNDLTALGIDRKRLEEFQSWVAKQGSAEV